MRFFPNKTRYLMNNSKGMSQTLALIVAASVLMMTALTVIFLAQGVLGDFGQDTTENACVSAVNSQCRAAIQASGGEGAVIQTPGACLDSDGNVIDMAQEPRLASDIETDQTACGEGSVSESNNDDDLPSRSITPEGCPEGYSCPNE